MHIIVCILMYFVKLICFLFFCFLSEAVIGYVLHHLALSLYNNNKVFVILFYCCDVIILVGVDISHANIWNYFNHVYFAFKSFNTPTLVPHLFN